MAQPLNNQECLTVRLSALGDAILTTGVLTYWQDQFGLTFHVLTKPALAPVFKNHPAVRGVIPLEESNLHGQSWMRYCRALARSFGHLPLIDLHVNLRTLILRALWPGPTRTYAKYSMTRRLFLATRHPSFAARLRRLNVPQRYALALEENPVDPALVRPRIYLDAAETAQSLETLSLLGAQRPIAIHPYATHPAKTPRPEVWKNLIRALEGRGEQLLILGRDAKPLLPGSPRDLTNTTDLRTLSALLSHCRCLITGDSGPMHLATAVGTPVIALFGPTTREWGFYPSGPRDIIHQSPCPKAPCSLHGQDACTLQNACMADISDQLMLTLLDTLQASD